MFSGFQKRLCELEYKSVAVLWRETVEELEDVPEEARGILVSVGTVLGRYDMHEQAETIKLAEQRLAQVRQQMREELRQQEKIFWALSTSAGGFLIILLL